MHLGFIKGFMLCLVGILIQIAAAVDIADARAYNGPYEGSYLNRLAFPIGGIGAGMVCLEGTGVLSHVSVRNTMEVFNEPCTFAAICIKGQNKNIAKVLEGPVPGWKIFGKPGTGNGAGGLSYGFPRFENVSFLSRFPFAEIELSDSNIPLQVTLAGWSPFIPGQADASSLPAGAIEYTFKNTTGETIEAVFSYNSKNFMASGGGDTILPVKNGFILRQEGSEDNPNKQGGFAIFTDDDKTVVDHCWFKGGWWDSLTLAWENIQNARLLDNPPVKGRCPGASLFVPMTIRPGKEKKITLMFAWYLSLIHI